MPLGLRTVAGSGHASGFQSPERRNALLQWLKTWRTSTSTTNHGALPSIAREYGRLWNAQRGVVEAEAVSASALDETEARGVSAAVSGALGKQVELRRRVDPRLMGGLLLRMEGRVYDGSVRARLRALRERLAGTQA